MSNHRGTYIDATGGYFKGKLVTTNGTQIDITDQGLSIDVDFYKIVPNYNIITITNNVISPSTLQVNFLIPGSTTLSSTVPTNCTFNYSIDGATATVINSGLQVNINLSSMTASSYIAMNLLENNEIIDSVRMTVTELQTIQGATGKNGQYSQDAYKNATESQASQSGFVPSSSTSTYPPSGWSATATTPNFAAGQYTWCITRTVTFDTNNNPVYGAWEGLHRITGDNGQPGEDGKYTEFIYRRFKTPPKWDNNNNLNPSYWAASDTPDYLGLAYSTTNSDSPNNKWTDNPRGVNETYQYEYVASRTYDGEHFSKFDVVNGVAQEPAVWAKWGEKGQDGDGVEYIFRHYTTEQTHWPNNNDNPCYWDANQADEYLGPSGYMWDDEPQGVDSTYKYEYYAIRTKKLDTNDNVVKWGKYNENSGTPKLWNKWGEDGPIGPTGPTGPTGEQGADAEYDVLVPVRETFEVTIGSNQVGSTAYENITGQLYTDLIYAVAHIKGNNVTYYDSTQLSSFKLNIRSRNGTSVVGNNSSINSTTITSVTINGTVCDALRYQTNNFLAAIWPNYSYRQDYYYLCENNLLSDAPTQVNVTLVNTSTRKNLDSRDVQLIFRPSNLFSVTDTALNSIYQGFSGKSGSYKTGMSQVYQDWSQIQTRVTDIENDYVNQSEFTQTANQIQSTISKMKTGGNNMVWGSASLKEVNSNTGDPYVFHPQEITPSLSNGINDLYGVYKYLSNGSTYDVLSANYVEVLPNTEYVMSFWAKGYGTIVSHMYYGNGYGPCARCENDEGVVRTNNGDGYTEHTLHSTWERHWVKYTTSAELPNDRKIKFIFARIPQNTTAYIYICGPKIELGNVPSDWSPAPEDDAQYVQSQITQSADKISLSVTDALLRTGIDIENGTINLNANNTNVNGTLNIYEDNQGLQVWNSNKTQCAQISNLALGYLENYNPSAYVSYDFSKTKNISGTNYTFAFYNSIGTAYPGVAMHINVSLYSAGMVGGDEHAFDGYGGNVSSMSYSVYLRNSGGTTRKSQSGSVDLPDPDARPSSWGVGLFSIDYTPSTSISSETLYIDLTLTINATSSHSGNAIAEVNVNFIQEISSTNKMSPDGIVLGTSNSNEYLWWGKKQIGNRTNYNDYAFMVRTRQNNFRVNDFGIWRTFYNQGYTGDNPGGTGSAAIGKYDDAYWGDISSTYPIYKTSSTSIDFATHAWSGILSIQRYGLIECTASGNATWTLPDPSICPGKYIIFKRRYSGHLYLTCTNKIIPRDNNVSAVTSTMDCEDDTVSIISDGEYWIVVNKA